ncbi:MAG: cellulase family glycosylhydrolase [Thiohalocapsa sp.]|nr:cellulase family glycosylhydrolase [Thiohalocapsa sp.]
MTTDIFMLRRRNAGPRRRRRAAISRALAILLICTPLHIVASDSTSPYGVHAHVTRHEYGQIARHAALWRQAGIQWVRTDFVLSFVESPSDQFDFSKPDRVVRTLDEADIGILGLLHDAPGLGAKREKDEEDLDRWLAFVEQTVERYKGRVGAWEIWNEPNLDQFWKAPDPSIYGKFLKATYKTIKSVDPNATVVFGATARGDWDFLERAAASSDGSFDVLAIHPYAHDDPVSPESYIPFVAGSLQNLLARADVGARPIWFTEWGWPTHFGRKGYTPKQQARYLVRGYILALHTGIERVFWYEFQDFSRTNERDRDSFGLVTFAGHKKPSFTAYQTLTKARPAAAKPINKPWQTGLVFHPAWRRSDGSTVHAIWELWGSPLSPRHMTVSIKGPITRAFDYLGEPVDLSVDENDRVTLALPPGSPLYIIGPSNIVIPQHP